MISLCRVILERIQCLAIKLFGKVTNVEGFVHVVEAHCMYFMQKRDAAGQLGHNALKIVV